MASEEAVRFGQTVLALRRSMGITQLELAKALGSHQTNVGRIENGTAEPSLSKLAEIAKFFGVPIGSLIDGTAAPDIPTVAVASSVVCSSCGIVGSGLTAAKAREFRTEHLTGHLSRKGED